MNRLADKICVVTGGGENIGKAICRLFANEGAIVCIFDSNKNLGDDTLNLIKSQGGKGCSLQVDVTNIQEINKSVEEILSYYERIDILINNVGGSEGLILEDIDEFVFLKNINLNLKSAVFCTKAVLPAMKKQHKGSVVFISSINALLGGFSECIYSASKGGLHSLANVLVADYSKYGIRFNVVCPGSIPGNSEIWQKREKARPGTLKRISELYPLGRVGVPNDVAYATMFLASDEAAWITGIVLPVDGGVCATGNLPGGKWWEKV